MEDLNNRYPLSPLQWGMLFHSQLGPESGVDIQQMIGLFRERLDRDRFRAAWQTVVSRHDVLRTSFQWEGLTAPLQRVHARVDLPFEEFDWRGFSPQERKKRFATYLREDRRRGFDLTAAPLMRVALFRFGERRDRFVWTSHHAIFDGHARVILLEELFSAYAKEPLRQPEPRPFRDFVEWLDHRDLAEAETFWKVALAGFTAPTPLGTAEPPDEAGAGAGDFQELRVRLTADETRALVDLGEPHGLPLSTFVYGAWAILCSRYSGESEVLFGVTRACRRSALEGAERMVGLFINTLPLRVAVSGEKELIPWLQEIRARQIAIREHEQTPLARIQEWSDVPRGTPMFDSIVVFETEALNARLRRRGGGWQKRSFRLVQNPGFRLSLTAVAGREMRLDLGYSPAHVGRATVGRMLRHLKALLVAMGANPAGPIAALPLLTAAERTQVLVEWNSTDAHPDDRCVHELFEQQVDRTPDAIAVVSGQERLTYAELERRSNQLANFLRGEGVGPDRVVGLSLERSPELVIGILGILKAGGAYAPLDPSYPAERLAVMLEDAQADVLLTAAGVSTTFSKMSNVRARPIRLDADWGRIADASSKRPETSPAPGNLAYLIYTSGSTGLPKGVAIPHGALANHMQWMQSDFPLRSSDRVLQKTPISFDASVWEFFAPLSIGAQLVMAGKESHRDTHELIADITAHGVTILQLVPSLLRVLLEEPDLAQCRSLRRVVCGGSVLTREVSDRFFERLSASLHNLYGPTETTIDATSWTCRPNSGSGPVPIGRPIANTRVYVLDRALQPVPVGVPGQMYIAGDSLARGYWNRPDATALSFIPDPFGEVPGGRMYRSGDLARWSAEGHIDYLGRVDHQIKIRGFRVELGEVEAMLRRHPGVRDAAVAAREDVPGDTQLVAYVVPARSPAPPASDLRRFLRQKLPDGMVPGFFVPLDRLPLTPSGKLNRRALPKPARKRSEDERFVSPRTPVEKRLSEIWSEILKVDHVSIEDDFFELGGHSLLATLVVSRIAESFGVQIPLRRLFEDSTLEKLGLAIAQTLAEAARPEEMLRMLAEVKGFSGERAQSGEGEP